MILKNNLNEADKILYRKQIKVLQAEYDKLINEALENPDISEFIFEEAEKKIKMINELRGRLDL